MTDALIPRPSAGSLVEREPSVAAWIDDQDDVAELQRARALLAAWRTQAERGSAERDAAIRLDIKAEIRIGRLPEAAPKPRGENTDVTGRYIGTPDPTPPAERVALSRARALAKAAERVDVDAVLATKPSRARVLAAAIEPTPDLEDIADRLRTPEQQRQARISAWKATASRLAVDYGRIDPPPTREEAPDTWASLTNMLNRATTTKPHLEVTR